MRRLIVGFALVGAVLFVATTAVHAQTPKLLVVPGSASQFQTLTVSGEGFSPGASLWVTFYSPTGEEIPYWSDGLASLIVERDGRFTLAVVPAVDFAGARAGRWRVAVCALDWSECWEETFTVLP
jgi:hypothetical protein